MSYFPPLMFHWAYRNAELLRWTLVDETIPLLDERRGGYDIFDGCRRTNAIALLMLQYWPALPEFREAMLHDYDSYMRQLCVEAISRMDEHGKRYIGDIRESIRKFSGDAYYQIEAVSALKRLGDEGSVPLLCELYEEARDQVVQLPLDKAATEDRGYLLLIDEVTSGLIKFDPRRAREILAMGLADSNPHVCYFTMRAFEISPLRQEMKRMKSSWPAVISSLPKDPSWVYRRRS